MGYLVSAFDLLNFSDCDVNDPFFNSLKEDYPGFEQWFEKKSKAGERAYAFEEDGVQAFLYIKEAEDEDVPGVLPKGKRMKIGTLKISEGSQGHRLGEGAIGIALWKWQQSDLSEIYVTIFEKQKKLIGLLGSFGFELAGKNLNGELVYVKDKRKLRYNTARLSFPYLNPNFERGKFIPINDDFHDKLFQYSELKNVRPSLEYASAASNGLSKVFIATPYSDISYRSGDIAVIYRRHTGSGQKMYKSVATSFCTILMQTVIKKNGLRVKSMEEYLAIVGNKSVYSEDELRAIYIETGNKNIVVIEMLYNGFFGAGHNVTYDTLKRNGLFEKYPYEIELTREDVLKILRIGGKNEQDIIIN